MSGGGPQPGARSPRSRPMGLACTSRTRPGSSPRASDVPDPRCTGAVRCSNDPIGPPRQEGTRAGDVAEPDPCRSGCGSVPVSGRAAGQHGGDRAHTVSPSGVRSRSAGWSDLSPSAPRGTAVTVSSDSGTMRTGRPRRRWDAQLGHHRHAIATTGTMKAKREMVVRVVKLAERFDQEPESDRPRSHSAAPVGHVVSPEGRLCPPGS